MPADLLNIAAWSAALLVHVVAADHLRRRLGIFIASQSVLMALGALAAAVTLQAGASTPVALLAAVAISGVAAVVHVAALFALGHELLLVATVALHFFFAEWWFASSTVTGGSGGLLVPSHRTIAILIVLFAAAGAATASHGASRRSLRFSWEMTRSLGLNGGVVGVPSVGLFFVSFGSMGMTAGLTGAAIMLLAGYLSLASFPLVWPLVALSIALVAPSIGPQVLLCCLYATMHVLLRTMTAPTSFASHAWEIAFPVLLLGIAVYRHLRVRLRTRRSASHATT